MKSIKRMLLALLVIILMLRIQTLQASFITDFEDAAWKVCTQKNIEYRYTTFCDRVYKTKYMIEPAFVWQDLINLVMTK